MMNDNTSHFIFMISSAVLSIAEFPTVFSKYDWYFTPRKKKLSFDDLDLRKRTQYVLVRNPRMVRAENARCRCMTNGRI